jgi:hypothetical protein
MSENNNEESGMSQPSTKIVNSLTKQKADGTYSLYNLQGRIVGNAPNLEAAIDYVKEALKR